MTVEDNIIAPIVDELVTRSAYHERRRAIEAFNASSPVLRRGLALTPVKFGIAFTATHMNQAGALVHVYTDGTILLNHGGTEMGQGLHTKVAQVVAQELQVDVTQIRCTTTDTSKVPNTSATAASSSSDLNGKAAQAAARAIKAAPDRVRGGEVRGGAGDDRLRRRSRGDRHGREPQLRRAGLGRLRRARVALGHRLLRDAEDPLRQGDAHRPAVLLLRLRRRRVRGDRRHFDGRVSPAAGGHPPRRRRVAQSRDRHGAGRGRLHAGRGLAHERGAEVGRGGAARRRTHRRPTRSRRRTTGRGASTSSCSPGGATGKTRSIAPRRWASRR